jgi:hypothetical protein
MSQTSAQSSQNWTEISLPRLNNWAAVRHKAAQSRSSEMQRTMLATSSSWRHAEAQCSHSAAQSLHAWMMLW